MAIEEILNDIEVWGDWLAQYKKFVPLFIKEAGTKTKWNDWNEEVFHEFFERSANQCVSSLKQGYFTHIEQDRIKEHWGELSPYLKILAANQTKPEWDSYDEIKIIISKYTSQDRRAATNRLIASLQPQLLCTIVNEEKLLELYNCLNDIQAENLPEYIADNWFRNSYHLLQYFHKLMPELNVWDIVTYPWQVRELLMDKSNNHSMTNENIGEAEKILFSKKQIILQGAPGTGKTFLAKKIAEEIIKNQVGKQISSIISESDILKYLHVGDQVSSATNYTTYKIEKIESKIVVLSGKNITLKNISFQKIIEAYKYRKWEPKKIKNGLDSYEAALALYINKKMPNNESDSDSKYIKLVQFHPSYTYEDFVRGINVQTQNETLEYRSVNKTLAKLAQEAQENWNLFNLSNDDAKKALESKSIFEQFIDYIQLEIDDKGQFKLTDNVYLFEYDETRFKYKGDNWEKHSSGLNMKYSEIKKIIDAGVTERSEIKKLTILEALTKSHATYYTKIIAEYYNFQKSNNHSVNEERPELKNYVLIIDEINRANLPCVLGELIYALEYRGERVESMYAVDGDNGLVLPPNLYIIGTMNTADRSVGQIDYAIRRRFAFINMLPKVLKEESLAFDLDLFKAVSSFFIDNIEEYINDPDKTELKRSKWLSDEFCPEDVWIGHSYFIMKNTNRDMKLNYEIKPILKEYLKDGILKETVDGKNTKTKINDL